MFFSFAAKIAKSLKFKVAGAGGQWAVFSGQWAVNRELKVENGKW
jgi:hypothetical protein